MQPKQILKLVMEDLVVGFLVFVAFIYWLTGDGVLNHFIKMWF